jgi:anti-sigma factor RsiW
MNHREAWELLDAYLDGSLPAAQRWGIAAHLEACAECRRYLAEQARIRGAVREELMAVEIPPDLTGRLRAALAAEAAAPPRPRLVWDGPTALRIAATLGPALAAVWLFMLVSTGSGLPQTALASELAGTHALFAHDETLFDVTGDAQHVTSWFHEKAGLSVTAPELAGFELAGGRLITIDGKPVAQLVYEKQPGDIYLSLMRFRDGEQPPRRMTGQTGQISTVMWPADGEQAALVGALPEAELDRLAGTLSAWSTGVPAEQT